jgi:hypothetical protein
MARASSLVAAAAGLLLAATTTQATNPWPMPMNLTYEGGLSSVATITANFAFTCDSSCDPSCTTDPEGLVSGAFARYLPRLRSSSAALAALAAQASVPVPSATTIHAGAGFWWTFPGDDCDGTQYDLGVSCPAGRDPANVTACQTACAANPNCGGFNTHGVMKNKVCGTPGSIQIGAGCNGCVDLYLLRTTPEPPPGNLTGISVCLNSGSTVLGSQTDESYSLVVPNNGVGSLTANTVFGMMRGLETLAQLVDFFNVPAGVRQISQAPVLVEDAPRYPYRGLLIDTSRHFHPLPQILHVIDGLAYNKMNLLHWHIVDEQSFPCGSKTYPQLAAKGAYAPNAIYSPDDLRTVVQYGKARGIRILPEWDVPGHGAWGAGIPQIMGCSDVLDPTQDYTYQVLSGFLGEMATIFIDDWMFLGGDEVDVSCWDANPTIAAWLKAHNMTSFELQQYFWEQMAAKVLPALNKTIGVWEADNLQVSVGGRREEEWGGEIHRSGSLWC